jgi:hypothetical protein
MNVISLNMCGVGAGEKKKKVSQLCNTFKINFLAIQETHVSSVDLGIAKSLWGNYNFDLAFSSSIGRSGGLLAIWDPISFTRFNSHAFENLLIIEGCWKSMDLRCFMIIVYAPQSIVDKRRLWSFISIFINAHPGNYIVFRDFNATRKESERLGTIFNPSEAEDFNDFIDNSSLFEIHMGGFAFTRLNKDGTKQSKLDRFFVSGGVLEKCPLLESLALNKKIADHRPILLRLNLGNFGPSPFKFFNFWMGLDGYSIIVESTWVERAGNCHNNPFIRFKEILKNLKKVLKTWNHNRKNREEAREKDLMLKIDIIDEDLENLINVETNKLIRSELLSELGVLEKQKNLEVQQKVKSKWILDGDENSKFFHLLVKKRRRQQSIMGIKLNGDWIDDPERIKNAFFDFHENRFKRFIGGDFEGMRSNFNRLDISLAKMLEEPPSLGEVRGAIWDCGSDKAPGPDGFSFAFVKNIGV